jgi:2-methylcitrate dehydratase PrpD
MKINQRVIDFCLNTQWDDLPDTVQHQSKRALWDNLGVLIAGGVAPVSRITNEFVEDQMAASNLKGACTVTLTGKKVFTVGAVANGIAANALDMDDGDKPAKGRP